MNKNIVIGALAVIALLFGALYLTKPIQLIQLPLGASPGPDHYNAETFFNTLTASCPRIYQAGATTNASTTYYLMASTTFGTNGNYTSVLATSTKPTNCP